MEIDWAIKWRELSKSWSGLEPPAVPSQQDIETFCDLAKSRTIPATRALILGSTPALRVAMSSLPEMKEIVCVDVNEESYRNLSIDLGPIAIETLVVADWLSMCSKLHSRSFDLIVGDKAIDNIPVSQWDIFLSQCKCLLKDGGSLILHVAFPDPGITMLSAEQVVKQNFASISEGSSPAMAASALWEDLLSHSSQFSAQHLTLKHYEHLNLSDQLTSDERAFLQSMTTGHVKNWYGKWANFSESDLVEALTAQNMTIRKRRLSTDYRAAKSQPIVCIEVDR